MHEEGCDWEMWTACAIDGLAVGDAIDFVACMDDSAPTDDNGKAEDVTEACADSKGLDFDAITACHDGDEGFSWPELLLTLFQVNRRSAVMQSWQVTW